MPALNRITDAEEPDVIIARRDEERSTYFPDAVRLHGGRVAVVFYRSRQHMHTPDSRIELVIGSPDGRTWSEPRTVVDTPGLDDRDPSIMQLRDGRLLLNWFRRDPDDLLSREHGVLCSHSDDLGDTWSEPVVVGSSLPMPAVTAPPLELADGRLLMPLYGKPDPSGEKYVLRIAVSDDRGQSWPVPTEIIPGEELPGELGLVEPTLAPLGGTDLLMVTRSRHHPANLAFALWSNDNGATWSEPIECDFAGHAPHLLPIGARDGVAAPLLMSWGEYAAVDTTMRPVKARLVNGHDRSLAGETVTLYSRPGAFDMSYPSSVVVADGSFLTVYYDAGAGVIAGTFTTRTGAVQCL